MKIHRKIIISLLAIFVLGCNMESTKEKNNSSKDLTEQKAIKNSFETNISEETTSNLCQVAEYLKNQNFNGDFYLYDNTIKWCMDVDSVEIQSEIISILKKENIEYVAHTKGIIEFGFNPGEYTKEIGEIRLILNNEPNNPTITSGNVSVKYIKLSNAKCLNLNWYLEIIK